MTISHVHKVSSCSASVTCRVAPSLCIVLIHCFAVERNLPARGEHCGGCACAILPTGVLDHGHARGSDGPMGWPQRYGRCRAQILRLSWRNNGLVLRRLVVWERQPSKQHCLPGHFDEKWRRRLRRQPAERRTRFGKRNRVARSLLWSAKRFAQQ